ncbi:carboxypeptidase-like regulatory domain-containing protein [Sphingobacterium sp. SRCM116780]|uniref:carboxypeptidase-like regulatory domain-containing protein n=1 Tax=Sphingobacterium sp. SRCM116780 TaxID=2907623 RepID=UPI001F4908B5|nr:carboxypeptidase-like regulatory domain-containing protein [Sphingobacterium sp. SRCM116780]UIR55483.1 carboxypeptidase-like regulatory domain-containing protein [Sphingobacterium sp. SRCM116780]
MSIEIPNTCSESWNTMSPTSKGKHCSKCQTEVMDFTNWKTDDIITYIQNSNTKVCGRILPSQSKTTYKPNLWSWLHFSKLRLGFIISGLLFAKFAKAETQTKNALFDNSKEQRDTKDSITITGSITDTSKKPLIGVMVSNNLTKDLIATDDEGRFSLKIPKEIKHKDLKLKFAHIGYEIKEISPNTSKNTPLKIELEEVIELMGEVIVAPYNPKFNKIDTLPALNRRN